MPRPVSHALITGASSGIGLALARQLAGRGAALTLVARDEARLKRACTELPAGTRVHSGPADVTQPEQLEAVFRAGQDAHGPYDLIVANAGQAEPGLFPDLPPDVFRQMMEVNFFGSLHTARLALPHFTNQGHGSLIFVASGAALTGLAGYSAYSPAKFAVRGLAESLRNEYAPFGIHIGLAYPPDTETPQLAYEEARKPACTKAITAGGGRLSAEQVAAALVRGYDRKKFLITPGWPMFLLARWHSLIAPLLWRHFDRKVLSSKNGKNSSRSPAP